MKVQQSPITTWCMTATWKIQCDGENSEPYRRRSEAFKDAVGLAHLDVRNGREADVIVQARTTCFRPEWDSTRDPYPPPLVPMNPENIYTSEIRKIRHGGAGRAASARCSD